MTEQPTRRQLHETIRDKFATMPTGVDHNGFSDVDRAATAASVQRALDTPYAYAQPESEAVMPGMRPNPAQGHGGAPTPSQANGDMLAKAAAAIQRFDFGDGAA